LGLIGWKTIRQRLEFQMQGLWRAFGSLDDHYLQDGGQKLLELFTYSTKDRDRNIAPKHQLDFTGDVYSKTANLKHSIKRYMEFSESRKMLNVLANSN
jgi:hypothetical protein